MWKASAHWMVYVSVADCDERVAAPELGAAVYVPPRDIQGRPFSVIADAQARHLADRAHHASPPPREPPRRRPF